MTRLRDVILAAGKQVVPSERQEDELRAASERMLSRVNDAASRFSEVRGVHLGGSFAKGTWLPRDVDLDIFVRIAEGVDDSRFEQVGLAVGEEAMRGFAHGKKYAQHPYTEAKVDDVRVNVVPCYDVEKGRWRSAADRSLYHVQFVNENMDAKAKHQVRLLKRFMKVTGVYGAEIEKEGFSGYASEVLVFAQGTFEGVLRYFERLKLEEEGSFSLRDPVDPDRELGTAVSRETVARMILASRAFLAAPDIAYFRRIRTRANRALAGRVYAIRFDHPPLSEDTLWGELKKSARQLMRRIESEGFAVAKATAASNDEDKSAILFLPEFEELPPMVERVGPGVDLGDEVKKFISKNRKKVESIWVAEDGKVHVLQKRRFTTLGALLEELCGSGLPEVGLSRDVALAVRKTGRILTGSKVKSESGREEWFAAGVESLVSNTIGTD